MEEQLPPDERGNKKGINSNVLLAVTFFTWIIGATTTAFAYTGTTIGFALPFRVCLIVSIVCGFLVGMLVNFLYENPDQYLKKDLRGVLATVLVFLAIVLYIDLRGSFIAIELIIPLILGLLPFFLFMMLRKSDTENEDLDQ